MRDLADVEHDAVEVEEDALAEQDVRAVVAKERRLHPDRIAAGAEQVAEDPPALVLLAFAGGVEVLAEIPGAVAGADEFGVEGVVEFAGEHLVAFGGHVMTWASSGNS